MLPQVAQINTPDYDSRGQAEFFLDDGDFVVGQAEKAVNHLVDLSFFLRWYWD
jgi:hypothetical protein